MPYLTNYHLSEHQASVLLGPVAEAVAELERRTGHYAGRVAMSATDREAMLAAQHVLAAARAELARIRDGASANDGGAP